MKARRLTICAAVVVSIWVAVTTASLGAEGERQWEAGGEVAIASDVTLLQSNVVTDWAVAGWDTSLSLAANGIEIDYEPVPFDFNGIPLTRREFNAALQFNGRRTLTETVTLLVGGGAYLGYTNYRSVWLDEYYRQQYAHIPPSPGFDTYEKAHPSGINAMLGARWAYQPGSGFAQLTVSQLSDRVAPGYEIDFDGLFRGPGVLNTTAINLDLENVVTSWARSLVRLRAAITSEREWRLGAEAWVNLALSDAWIARLNIGYTEEAPNFDARFGGFSVERSITPNVSLIASGRYYRDTGEIENALLFTSSAPALESWQAHAGLRWIGEHWSGRFTVGVLRSRYAETNPSIDFFQNLYRDRNWTVGQLAVRREF